MKKKFLKYILIFIGVMGGMQLCIITSWKK